jgi:ketosteroid isomerase-like protein
MENLAPLKREFLDGRKSHISDYSWCLRILQGFSMTPSPTAKANPADVAVLFELNRNYVRSAQESDVAWYEANLGDDYVCSYRDGSIIDKTAFLARIAQPGDSTGMAADEVQVQVAGELALVHSLFKYKSGAGVWGMGRYTDIYTQRATPQGERWVCVSAHFNCF